MLYVPTVVFSHQTALERLRSVPPQLDNSEPFENVFRPNAHSTNTHAANKLNLSEFGIRETPVNVLIGCDMRPTTSPRVRPHSAGLIEYPGWLIKKLTETVYCCGPELVFIQLASSLPLVDAVVLGFELCGSYSHFSSAISGFYDRKPLTSVEKIASAIDALKGLRGLPKAMETLKWVADGARSPMETVLACCLGLPASLGGLGFSAPVLNHKVELEGIASKRAGSKSCYIDLAWPEGERGLEYNGAAFHPNAAKDRRRIEGLEHMGWSINTLDLAEMSDFGKLWDVAGLLKGKVQRIEDATPMFREARQLHHQLLESTRFGLGLEGVLFGVPAQRGSITYHI